MKWLSPMAFGGDGGGPFRARTGDPLINSLPRGDRDVETRSARDGVDCTANVPIERA